MSNPAAIKASADELRRFTGGRVHHILTEQASWEGAFPHRYPRVIVRGEGAYLFDEAGHRLLDASQHLGACQIGHGREEMAVRLAEQVRTLEFSSLESGVTHNLVGALAARLEGVVPVHNPYFFFCCSGSEANELAFKVARQYHARRGQAAKVKVLSRVGSYHGSSFGAISATGNPALREPFAPVVPGFRQVSQPSPGRCGRCGWDSACDLSCADDLERAIVSEGAGTVAAFIGEPISVHQATKVPHPRYWKRVGEICDSYGVLLILDEVVTGFGRTGAMFGADYFDVIPDVITVAKGITSGYVPVGAAVVSGEIGDTVKQPLFPQVNTYAAHPLGCAAALENLRILEEEGLLDRVRRLEPVMRTELSRCEHEIDAVFRTSCAGLLGGLEFRLPEQADGAFLAMRVRHECYERGLLVRCLNDGTIGAAFLFPPFVVDEGGLTVSFGALRDVIANVLRSA